MPTGQVYRIIQSAQVVSSRPRSPSSRAHSRAARTRSRFPNRRNSTWLYIEDDLGFCDAGIADAGMRAAEGTSGHGRNAPHGSPPVQIPASATNAPGSYLR